MATTKRCAKLASLNFILKNVIYLFITTEIVELFLYIRKSSGLVIKMSTSKPCHYVVLELRQEILLLLVQLSTKLNIPDVIASDPI